MTNYSPQPKHAGFVMVVLGFAQDIPCPVVGQYLEWYDPRIDPASGKPIFGFTDNIEQAMTFAELPLAVSKYREPLVDAQNVPRQRPDGSGAERPLTAFSVSIEPYEETP